MERKDKTQHNVKMSCMLNMHNFMEDGLSKHKRSAMICFPIPIFLSYCANTDLFISAVGNVVLWRTTPILILNHLQFLLLPLSLIYLSALMLKP